MPFLSSPPPPFPSSNPMHHTLPPAPHRSCPVPSSSSRAPFGFGPFSSLPWPSLASFFALHSSFLARPSHYFIDPPFRPFMPHEILSSLFFFRSSKAFTFYCYYYYYSVLLLIDPTPFSCWSEDNLMAPGSSSGSFANIIADHFRLEGTFSARERGGDRRGVTCLESLAAQVFFPYGNEGQC
jgi:hypothetical protein